MPFDIVINATKSFAGFVGKKLPKFNLDLELQGEKIVRYVNKCLRVKFKENFIMQADSLLRDEKLQCTICS